MERKYFVSLEVHKPELTARILPRSAEFGFDSVTGMSGNLASDIEGIQISQQIKDAISADGIKTDEKYNRHFFGHLPKEHTFNNPFERPSYDEERQIMVERHFMMHKFRFHDEEDELLGSIFVCEKPTPVKISELHGGVLGDEESDPRFLTREEAVSSRHILN